MTEFRIWQIAGWTMLHYLWVGGVLGVIAVVGRRGCARREQTCVIWRRYAVSPSWALHLYYTAFLNAMVATTRTVSIASTPPRRRKSASFAPAARAATATA